MSFAPIRSSRSWCGAWGCRNSFMKRVLILILFCLVWAPVLRAQTTDQEDVIRVDTDVTNLPFTVTDRQRRFITTLQSEDVRVLEDGVPQTVTTFERETDRPLEIAFLIDVSRSQEFTLPDEKAAARLFIEKVIDSNKDQVAVLPFTGLAYLEQGLTRDLLSVYRVLERVEVAAPAYLGTGQPLPGIPTGPGLLAPPDACLHGAVAGSRFRIEAVREAGCGGAARKGAVGSRL